ncbi:hypothetical protein GQ43DRAFT_232187 [Delitschia confertaspora ATCC 74209]|uniref:ferric-chelate reductase (NADPH) n=1 Tax=Delitschia confertaspora ATCC 74209 TaxID=1513339 RepID=A0A9P4JV87_9PLEO|nr:hypothetical protein GQ43DRAFT_232187 [Delitschia confertaspora ATCC 74209]
MPPSPSNLVYAPQGWPSTPLPSGVSVEDLPISDSHCTNDSCRAFRYGYAADQEIAPLLGLLEYGKWTVYFYSFWILLFTGIHVYYRIRDRATQPKQRKQQSEPSVRHKLLALVRSISYQRPTQRFINSLGLRSTSYGILILLAFTTIFFIILPWPQRHYLRARFRFGSPPLSVRCALIISALTPLTVAFAGKVNIITFLTGAGYQKLNVFHRYTSYVIFCAATVHTVPHLIAPVRDGGWGMLNALYYNQHRELSGTPLYFVTFGLSFFSIPWVRRRFYEAFKYVHIFLAVSYIALLWWHIWGEYMSPNYLYATLAVWAFSNILRALHRHYHFRAVSTLSGFPTTLTHLAGNMTRVTVSVPSSFKWKPGQHAFLRIPGLSMVGNHPFSIANLPSEGTQANEMVFLVRKQKGFTRDLFHCDRGTAPSVETLRLEEEPRFYSLDLEKRQVLQKETPRAIQIDAFEVSSPRSPLSLLSPMSSTSPISLPSPPPSVAFFKSNGPTFQCDSLEQLQLTSTTTLTNNPNPTSKSSPLRAIIDGPYGCHIRPLHLIYDTVIFVAGGSGITASTSHLISLSRHIRDSSSSSSLNIRNIHLIWLVREPEWLKWIESELGEAVRNIRSSQVECEVTVDIFVTRNSALAESARTSDTSLRTVASGPSKNTIVPKPLMPFSEKALVEALVEGKRKTTADPEKRRPSLSTIIKPAPVYARESSSGWRSSDEDEVGVGYSGGAEKDRVRITTRFQRPVVGRMVEEMVTGERAVVMACGPPSLTADLANTVAGLQRGVYKAGKMKEVKLEIEVFGW